MRRNTELGAGPFAGDIWNCSRQQLPSLVEVEAPALLLCHLVSSGGMGTQQEVESFEAIHVLPLRCTEEMYRSVQEVMVRA